MTTRPYDVPPFAERCLDASRHMWGASFEHPFILKLADGTLEAAHFRFYQMQDARYLEAFSDAAALISTRVVSPVDKLWFVDAARVALVGEAQLHVGYGKKLGYTPEDIAAIELTPNNRGYQDHMISMATRGSLVEAVAALAPCPWLYIELGQHLLKQLGTIEDSHPYADWLRMYSDPGFNDFAQNLLSRLQAYADEASEAQRARAVIAFQTSVRYEWMFWQQAWEQQRWPI